MFFRSTSAHSFGKFEEPEHLRLGGAPPSQQILITTSYMGALHRSGPENDERVFCQIPPESQIVVLGPGDCDAMTTVLWCGTPYSVFTVDVEAKTVSGDRKFLTQAA